MLSNQHLSVVSINGQRPVGGLPKFAEPPRIYLDLKHLQKFFGSSFQQMFLQVSQEVRPERELPIYLGFENLLPLHQMS